MTKSHYVTAFFMRIFFTGIGFTASLKVLKQDGVEVLKILLLCAILIFLQNGAEIATAGSVGFNIFIHGSDESEDWGIVQELLMGFLGLSWKHVVMKETETRDK